jgi:hypothetical protein
MPSTEAQKRAIKKWNDKNKERVAKYKSDWIERNRETHNENNRIRMKNRHDVLTEFKTFRKILLDL